MRGLGETEVTYIRRGKAKGKMEENDPKMSFQTGGRITAFPNGPQSVGENEFGRLLLYLSGYVQYLEFTSLAFISCTPVSISFRFERKNVTILFLIFIVQL